MNGMVTEEVILLNPEKQICIDNPYYASGVFQCERGREERLLYPPALLRH